MILPFRIEEIQRAIVNSYVLCKGIAAEVHYWGDCASPEVDPVQGAKAVVDENGVKLLSGNVGQYVLLPTAVGFHLAVPFAVFVEGEGIAFQQVAVGVED